MLKIISKIALVESKSMSSIIPSKKLLIGIYTKKAVFVSVSASLGLIPDEIRPDLYLLKSERLSKNL